MAPQGGPLSPTSGPQPTKKLKYWCCHCAVYVPHSHEAACPTTGGPCKGCLLSVRDHPEAIAAQKAATQRAVAAAAQTGP